MNLQTATPAEIDILLSAIYVRAYRAEDEVTRWANYLRNLNKHGEPRNEYEAAQRAEWAVDYAAKRDAAREVADAVWAECAPYDAEYDRRGGWSRAFIVQDGHVHTSMRCSSCYPTTRFGWLPEVSGQSEAEIVAQAGEGACTICYPSAPVMPKGSRTLFTQDEIEKAARRAEREAKAAAKAAAKAEKALGVSLRGPFGQIDSIPAAKSFLTDAAEWKYDHPYYTADKVQPVAEALAARLGSTVEQVKADAEKRAAKRR